MSLAKISTEGAAACETVYIGLVPQDVHVIAIKELGLRRKVDIRDCLLRPEECFLNHECEAAASNTTLPPAKRHELGLDNQAWYQSEIIVNTTFIKYLGRWACSVLKTACEAHRADTKVRDGHLLRIIFNFDFFVRKRQIINPTF